MPKRLVLFVLLLVGLTACGGADVAPGSGAEEPALVTDADLDAAAFVGAEELRALDLRALPLESVPSRATGFAARVSAQQSPAVPLDNTSQLAYVQRRGNNTRVVLRETRAEGRGGYRQVLVYNSAREVSSVAVSGDAQLLVFTAEARDGNAEVYALDRDGSRLGGAGRLVRLTNTGADESDVSMSLGGDLIGWATEVGDAPGVAFAVLEPRLQVVTLDVGGVALTDPSLSGDGETLVVVADGEDLGEDQDVIIALPVAEGDAVGLYQGNPRDPSLSFDGSALLFAEDALVTYIDLEAGELTDLLTGTDANHPFLTSDGLYFTYAADGEVRARLVDAEAPADAPEDVIDGGGENSEAYWAKADFELRYSASTLGGPTFVRPDDGSGVSAADRTVPYHRYSFVAPVSDRYQVRSEQDYDGYLLLYEGFFNPRRPSLNLLAFNDDFGGGFNPDGDPPGISRLTSELEAGQRYIVVTTSFDSGSAGLFTNTVTRNIPPPPPPFVLPDPDGGGYNITLRFVTDNLTPAQQAVFEDAAARWSSIITEDIENIPDFALPEAFSFPDAAAVEGTLDDLLIDVAFNNIDGPSGVLGRAGPRLIRQDTADDPLSIYGIMEFDISEFGNGGFFDDQQQYEDVIVHEMGHVLGIGTLWELTGNTDGIINPGDDGFPDGPPTVPPGLPNPDYDPRFTGAGAVTEYQTLLDAAGRPGEDTVPIANDGGPGNYNGHWRELTFDNELMTPYAGGVELLSRMTAASLGDTGYTVTLATDAVDQGYALPLPASFAQTAPDAVTYTEYEDFLKFSGSVGSAEATVQAVDLALGAGNTSTSGCEAADFAGFTAGNIALVQRGTCPFVQKVETAAAAGAVGVVMMNQGNTEDPARTGVFSGGVGNAGIPAVGITYALGLELAELADAGTLTVAIDTPSAVTSARTADGTLSTAAVRPDFEEELLEPIGTVSPGGIITFFE